MFFLHISSQGWAENLNGLLTAKGSKLVARQPFLDYPDLKW